MKGVRKRQARWAMWPESPGEWGTRKEEGEGEYCLESGQVLLEHCHLPRREEQVPGLSVTASAWDGTDHGLGGPWWEFLYKCGLGSGDPGA